MVTKISNIERGESISETDRRHISRNQGSIIRLLWQIYKNANNILSTQKYKTLKTRCFQGFLAHPARIERAPLRLGGGCSIP